MRLVDFEFNGVPYTLPRTTDLPVECFRNRSFSTLIENAPDGILDFMWGMSVDEANSFFRVWAEVTRAHEKAETPGLTRLEAFNQWMDRNHNRIFLGAWSSLVVVLIVRMVVEHV